jgi:hypothetical protein
MQTRNADKQLGKLGTVHIERNEHYAKVGRYYIGFYDQDGEAICIHTRPEWDHDELQSDYDAHSYWRNLTRAIRYVTVHAPEWDRKGLPS